VLDLDEDQFRALAQDQVDLTRRPAPAPGGHPMTGLAIAARHAFLGREPGQIGNLSAQSSIHSSPSSFSAA
jgi:hypothetical protein